jgi:hypothetical protein
MLKRASVFKEQKKRVLGRKVEKGRIRKKRESGPLIGISWKRRALSRTIEMSENRD